MAAGMAGGDPNFDPDAFVTGEISLHDVMDMKKAFDMIDDDGSGLIDAHELQGAAVALGIHMEQNIRALLGDEKLTFAEFFKRMTAKLSPEDTVDDIMSIFELFDADGTGTISLSNMQTIARMICAKETDDQIQDMLNMLDTDNDGELDPIDFYTCLVYGMRIRMEDEKTVKNREAESRMREQAAHSASSTHAGLGMTTRRLS